MTQMGKNVPCLYEQMTAVPAAAHSCPAVPSKRQHPAQSLGAGRDLFAGYAPECSLRTRVAVRQGGSCGCLAR